MKKSNTAERLKQIMDVRNLRQVDVLELAAPFCKKYNVKLAKNDLSQYLSGKYEPKQDKLTVLGLALNVSEAWLMGFDVPVDRNVEVPITDSDGYDKEYMELFQMLDNNQKSLIIHAIKGLLSD